MEIAIFGGTFNPPTKAHHAIVQEAARLPFIDEVWVMPSGQRDDKQFEINNSDRLAMINIMISHVATAKTIRIEPIELELASRTHTANTVSLLEDRYPDEKFWYIFGVDSYVDMPNWNDGNRLRDSLHMLVAPRGEHVLEETERVKTLQIGADKITSSTEVRSLRQNGGEVEHLVCSGVAQYIYDHALYERTEVA